MRTYKHKFEELQREAESQKNYEIMFLNLLGETLKLREIAKAIQQEDSDKLNFELKDWEQMYGRLRQ